MTDIAASSIAWHLEWHGSSDLPPLVMVHGFAGSLHTWDRLIDLLAEHFHLMLVDLPGHGRTPVPTEGALNLPRLGAALGQLIQNAAEEPAHVFGYSMGARIALHTALTSPERVASLALLGASPGIAEDAGRAMRAQSDRELAANIRARGTKWFAEYWGNLPLFASQKSLSPELQNRLLAARSSGSAEGLAYALEHFGTGTQEFLLPRLGELRMPTLLMAGALDSKFCAINHAMETAMAHAPLHRVEIPGAGHAAHLEAPEAVAQALLDFHSNR